MSTGASEQHNPYKGSPARCWLRLRVVASDGSFDELNLLADTGNPCAVIIGQACMARFKLRGGRNVNSNFGPLVAGWLRIQIPAVNLDQEMLGYASDTVVTRSKRSSPDFEGLAGLPLLR